MGTNPPPGGAPDSSGSDLTDGEKELALREFGFEGVFDIHSDAFHAQRILDEEERMEGAPISIGGAAQPKPVVAKPVERNTAGRSERPKQDVASLTKCLN